MEISSDIKRRWQRAVDAFRMGDKVGALFIFKSLAKEGFYPAYTEVGNIYELGGDGIEQDFDEALRCYRKAAFEDGNEAAFAALGRLYFFGRGVERDFDKAFEYYGKILSNRDPVVLLMYGHRYHAGLGAEVDTNKAREYYEEAADKGNVYAIVALGVLEKEEGNFIRGILLKLKGIVLGFYYYYLRDKNDIRLKSC